MVPNTMAVLLDFCPNCAKLDILDFDFFWAQNAVVEWVEISQKNFARFFGPRMFVRS